MTGNILNYLIAIISFSGGLVAYLKKSSLPSLIGGKPLKIKTGTLIGLLFFYATILKEKEKNEIEYVSGVILLLVGLFRLYVSKKFMPAGVLSILGLISLTRKYTNLNF
jgi:uncharacterized membrane protein (UPF0136 family)